MKIVSHNQPLTTHPRTQFIVYKFLLNSNLIYVLIIQLVPKIIVSHFYSVGNFGLGFHLELFVQTPTKIPWTFDQCVWEKIRDYYLVRSGMDFCQKCMKHVALVWVARKEKPKGITKQQKIGNMVGVACRNILFSVFLRIRLFQHTHVVHFNFSRKRISVLYGGVQCPTLLQSDKKQQHKTKEDVFFQFSMEFFHLFFCWLDCCAGVCVV